MTPLLFNGARSVVARGFTPVSMRYLSTLKENPAIYHFKDDRLSDAYILTLLPTDPPSHELAIGTTTRIPPTPDTFHENPRFLEIMDSVLKEWAARDPRVHAEAQTLAHQGGFNYRSGGMSTPARTTNANVKKRGKKDASRGASAQAGMGGNGSGGFIHVTDERCPPAFGRIACPEDIFGSLQVASDGTIEGDGGYQPSGAYRIVTKEGM
ncbi:hypothetical protein KEM54_005800 [Ascosphaera aggregata]|nr:hypothetical protein KEM54_005800 [Ascosphaera aggregata]